MHFDLVNLFNQLGYPETAGLCHGLAIRWIEACLLNEEQLFLERLDAILARGLALKKDFVRAKAKKGKNLTAEDLACFDVMGFFDSLAVFQDPAAYSLFSGQRMDQGNVDLFSSSASSNKIRELGGLASVYSSSNLYHQEEIKNYFDSLTNLMDALDLPSDETLCFLLSSIKHSIALSYTKSRGWFFMDSNQYPPKSVSTAELPQLIAQAFFLPKDENYLAFTTRVITTQNNPKLTTLRDTFNQLEQRYLLTEERIEGNSHLSSLAQLLVANNELPKLKQLMSFNANIRQQLMDNSAILTLIAAQSGHVDVLAELAKCGVDLEQPALGEVKPIYFAVRYGHAAVVAELAKHGVDLDQLLFGEVAPIYFAVRYGHTAVVAELAKHGVDLNQLLSDEVTPLYIAAEYGHEAIVMDLISRNVDVDRPSAEGATPIFIAAQLGHRPVVELLLKQKANLNLHLIKSVKELIYFSVCMKDEQVIRRMNDFVIQQALKESPENKNIGLNTFFRWVMSSFDEMPEGSSTWFFNLFRSIANFMFYCVYRTTSIQVSPYDIALIMGHSDIANLLCPPQSQISLSSNRESFFSAPQNTSEPIAMKEQTEFFNDGVLQHYPLSAC
ncbi:MAG: ankyrin repeat domain-containing protein [Legionella sp.]|uniref:ankyrin repeat domain-containing protein n=1 Tax=Legionella sp. TaxID=459 RepID=UPI0028470DB6|nr:ankyrin repeat domain-containing protein [Legionella sp.]